MAHNCFYKDQICHYCGKQGHIQQDKPKQAARTPEVHGVGVEVDVNVDTYDDVLATLGVHNVSKQSKDIIWVDLNVDSKLNPLEQNWTQVRLCRLSRLISTSRNLTIIPLTKPDCS